MNSAAFIAHEWLWDGASKGVKACEIGFIEPAAAQLLAGGARVIVAGDSVSGTALRFFTSFYFLSIRGLRLELCNERWQVARNFYYALARALGDDVNNAHNATAPRHADISMVLPPQLGGGNLRFLWAPYAANLTTRFDKLVSSSKKCQTWL